MIGLEFIRQYYKVPQEKIAVKLGISKQMVSLYETQQKCVSKEKSAMMEKITHVPAEYIGKSLSELDVVAVYKILSENDRNPFEENRKYKMTFIDAVNTIKGDRSIRRMAMDTGISASYITGILKGKYYPTLKILKRLTSPKSNPYGDIDILDLIVLLKEEEI